MADKRTMRFAFLALVLTIFVSCGQQDFNRKLSDTRVGTNNTPTLNCPCSNEINPVCGANGQTYTNSCYANCNQQNFTLGACVTTDCSKSGVVCGKPNSNCNVGDYCSGEDDPAPQDYENDCKRIEAKATLLHVGACTSDDT